MWYYGDIKTYGHNYGGHNIDAQGHHRRRPHWSTQRHLARKWSLIDASPYLEVPVKPSYVDINIYIYIYIQLIDVISNFKITHKRSYIPTKKMVFCLKSLSHLLHLSHKDVCHWVHCQSQAPVRGSAESMVHWKLRALISSQMEVFAKYNIHISYVLWVLMRLIYIYIHCRNTDRVLDEVICQYLQDATSINGG